MQPQGKTEEHSIKSVEQTTCCIVGGGPAGAVLAYMLARTGIAFGPFPVHVKEEQF